MRILQRIFGGKQEKRASSWDLLAATAFPSRSGAYVSPALIEGLSAVFCAVTIISESIGSLPLIVYRQDDAGARQVDPSHPVARLFSRRPNDLQSPAEFLIMMQANVLLHGAAYAEIIRDGRGAPEALWPINPAMVSVERLPDRRIRFMVTEPEGGTRRLLPGEVFALRDRFDDPFTPISRLQRAREALGGALATERFAASVWRNGAAPSGILTHPEAIGAEAAVRIREGLQALYAGADNAGRIGVLEEGMTWQSISSTPHDAELSEARRLAVLDVARIFNIPAPLLNELTNANYSNVVEMRRQFAVGTIQPWLVRWEQAVVRDLFSEEGQRSHAVEFDLDLLVRADFLQRLQGYRIGRETGLYSANDLRRFERLNPRTDPDAEAFLSPLNMHRETASEPKIV